MNMAKSIKKAPGHIHRIREFELEKVILSDEFDILQIVGEGWFGKILLVEHRATDTEMVLKALPKPYVSLRDFYREFHYGLHLGVHKNIVTTYDVAFETAGFYVFTQEYAPLGDLTSNVLDTGIGELHTKRVAKQLACALDFLRSKEIVHRDVKLDNVLVCRSDFSRVKLCDFGESRRANSLVQRRNEWLPYSPPEVLLVKTDDTYKTVSSHDVWQFGIVIFVCLTGCLPWQKAAPDDPRYVRYLLWHGSSMVIPMRRTPKLFKLLSSKACKMFRKFLEPNPERRPDYVGDLQKFLDDRWLTKGAEKNQEGGDTDELCASMYSFHSSPEEKNKLLATLAQHGLETTVDRAAKKKRIRDWIQTSIITEEDEEEDSGSATPSSTQSRTPIAGHVSSIRAQEEAQKKITSTVKDASNKHIDPRTGLVQQGPSEMGAVIIPSQSPPSPPHGSEAFANNNNTKHLVDGSSQTSTFKTNINPTKELVNGRSNGMKKNIFSKPIKFMSKSSSTTTSKGILSIGNAVATTSVPEIQTLGRMEIFGTTLPITDSGYGSMDKIKSSNGNVVYSPILSKKRSASVKSTNREKLVNRANTNIVHDCGNGNGFDSGDSGSDDRGSIGFVNLAGTMKDTAYDNINRPNKKL